MSKWVILIALISAALGISTGYLVNFSWGGMVAAGSAIIGILILKFIKD